jgi:hypothetical protein
MQDERDEKKTKKKEIKVPPTGAKTDSAVEPADKYELDVPVDEEE